MSKPQASIAKVAQLLYKMIAKYSCIQFNFIIGDVGLTDCTKQVTVATVKYNIGSMDVWMAQPIEYIQ